jgi:hypothetical protein
MSKIYSYDKWEETFKPIKNHFRNNDDIAFETYGDEVEFVQKADIKNIWTEVQGDEGFYIVAGYHWVNRLQYFITEKPWEDEYTEVPTGCSNMCECYETTEDEDYDPDCELCDEGSIDIPCETLEDLKAIYGEEAEIIA